MHPILINLSIMINIKKLALNIELTIHGSIIIDRNDVNKVPDAIVKDGKLFIISDGDCQSVLYKRSVCSLSDFVRILFDIYPDSTYTIAYV